MPIRLAHIWSSDLGIPPTILFSRPLLARGWEIAVFSPDGPRVPLAREAGMVHVPLALERRIDPISDALGTLRLARDLRRRRFDIVHTHNIKTGLIGRVVAGALRAPILVHTLHGLAYSLDTPPLRRRAHAALERAANLAVDLVFSQSEEDLETVVATGAIDRERVRWIGNGIDLAKYHPAAISDEERRRARQELGVGADDVLFLSAGRLVREKGFAELFAAAAIARQDDARVRLAVAGPVDAEKADAIDDTTLARAREAGVLVLGERRDMPRLYAAADVVALASWREGMPRVLMEGAAMGKPLLASDTRGCREIVRPPKNGLLAPLRDAAGLARGMLALAGDAPLRARLGADNAAEARERYDVRAAIDRVIAAYDELLAARGILKRP